MGLLDEFKSFISNGNVLDLTVGVITGAAFSKVVSSFTDDIIMPSAALLKSSLQRVPGASAINPDALAAAAKLAPPTATVADSGAAHVAHAAVAAAADSGATAAHVAAAATDTAAAAHAAVAAPATLSEGLATIGIGNFISSIVYFLIISLVILLVTKVANRFRKPAEVEVVNEHDLEPVLSREEALLIEIRDALLRSREQQ